MENTWTEPAVLLLTECSITINSMITYSNKLDSPKFNEYFATLIEDLRDRKM